MAESEFEAYVNLVLTNLEKHGFPANTVTFPLEKMYESASRRGFSFNKVRDVLKERGIASEISGERVIFQQMSPPSGFEGDDLMKQAEEMMRRMSPDQIAQITKMMQGMPAGELEKMQEQWSKLSAEEKAKKMEEFKKFSPLG